MPRNTSTPPCASSQKFSGQWAKAMSRSRAKKATPNDAAAHSASSPARTPAAPRGWKVVVSGGLHGAAPAGYWASSCQVPITLSGVERDRRDALARQPLREVRVVAGPLAADADVLALRLAGGDGAPQQRQHVEVALVEVGRQQFQAGRGRAPA